MTLRQPPRIIQEHRVGALLTDLVSSQRFAPARRVFAYIMVFAGGVLCARLAASSFFSALSVNAPPLPQWPWQWALPVPPHDFLAAFVIADAAVALAALLYLFAARKRRVHTTTKTPGPRTSSSQGKQERQANLVEAVRAALEAHLAVLIDSITRHIETSEAQSGLLDTAHKNLSSANSSEKVRAIIDVLTKANAQELRDGEKLRAALTEARLEAAALRQELMSAHTRALIDVLTALPNRRAFDDFLARAVAKSHNDETPLCLVLSDVDHFKAINDRHGHRGGDAVLQRFARLLMENVRADDYVARYGGEEFAVIMRETPLGNAVAVAERLRDALGECRWPHNNGLGGVTASFGVAEIKDRETPEQLIDRADRKLYVAKNAGRNRVETDSASKSS